MFESVDFSQKKSRTGSRNLFFKTTLFGTFQDHSKSLVFEPIECTSHHFSDRPSATYPFQIANFAYSPPLSFDDDERESFFRIFEKVLQIPISETV